MAREAVPVYSLAIHSHISPETLQGRRPFGAALLVREQQGFQNLRKLTTAAEGLVFSRDEDNYKQALTTNGSDTPEMTGGDLV